MKRIVYFLLIFTLIFTLIGTVVASAEEVVEDVQTEVVPDTTTETEVAEEEEKATLFTRLYEAFVNNKTDVFTLSGSGILLIISLILKKDLGSSSKKVVENVAKVLSKTDISDEKQNAIIGGLNEMVDGYNELKAQSGEIKETISAFANQVDTITQSNAALETKIDEVFAVIINLMDKEIAQNGEVMDVLSSVYTNNKALSQGVKDYVALKRAENAKIMQEAAILVHKDEGVANE